MDTGTVPVSGEEEYRIYDRILSAPNLNIYPAIFRTGTGIWYPAEYRYPARYQI
jgi:hypothetical protein